MRRTLVSMGAKEKPGGSIEHTPQSLAFVVIFILVMIGIALLVEFSK